MTNTATARPDVYSRITDKIITDLEQGVRPWLGPAGAPPGRVRDRGFPLGHGHARVRRAVLTRKKDVRLLRGRAGG